MIKCQVADEVVAFNPIGKESGQKVTRFGADLVLVSLSDSAYNGTEAMALGSKTPLVLDGPGEYEARGIFIRGVGSPGPNGKINTVYSVLFDGIRLMHLGAITGPLSDDNKEKLGETDILFVPLGFPAAAGLATELAAKLTVPVDYDDDKQLEKFLKEVGAPSAERLDRLTIKKKDLIDKEAVTMVINQS